MKLLSLKRKILVFFPTYAGEVVFHQKVECETRGRRCVKCERWARCGNVRCPCQLPSRVENARWKTSTKSTIFLFSCDNSLSDEKSDWLMFFERDMAKHIHSRVEHTSTVYLHINGTWDLVPTQTLEGRANTKVRPTQENRSRLPFSHFFHFDLHLIFYYMKIWKKLFSKWLRPFSRPHNLTHSFIRRTFVCET